VTRTAALLAGIGALALTLAQELYPQTPLYHTWQYALAMAAAIVVLAGFAWAALRGTDRAAGVAALGFLVIALDGATSGLIGPDTETIARAPGTVQPLADLKAAAFFPAVDRDALGAETATLLIRRRNEADIVVPNGGRAYLGTSVLYTQPQRAAYIVARTASGDRLTVTQPAGSAFLSPVLLFPKEQKIADKSYRYDQFALPAEHRVINALYFSAADLAISQHGPAGIAKGTDAVLFGVNNDAGGSVALGFAPSGKETLVGDVRLTAYIGTYPALVIASGPEPTTLAIGFAIVVGGLAWFAIRSRPTARPAPSAPERTGLPRPSP
jgi:hypothetical protein